MTIVKFPSSKAREKIFKQFPPVSSNELPHIYEIKIIEYEKQRIEKYAVLFWHRLLKTIYQEPQEIECESLVIDHSIENPTTFNLRKLKDNSKWEVLNSSKETVLKIQSGEIKHLPVNWKYFISLSSSEIILIGTKDQCTALYFAHVLGGHQVKNEACEQAKKLISLLLDEAKKEKNNKILFDPLKEFKNNDGLKFYYLFNVYLANYFSAKSMLNLALTQEKIQQE